MFRIAKNAIIILTVSAFSIASAASNNSADLLKYVPADTPYVFASTQPLPSALADKLEPTVDEILQAYQSVLRHVMTEQLAKMSSEEGSEEETEQLTALMEEVLGLMSLDGIRGAGIERESAFVVYGNGLLPVLRLELADSKLFDAAVARIEDKAGKQLMLGEAKGTAYKYANADKINLIIATLDGQAVITAVPASYDEAQVALAIGVNTPRKNLKKSKDLRSIRKEYGFSEYLTGFISTERLAGIFAGKTTKQDDEFFAAIGDKPPEVSDVCAAEIMQMAGIAPRVVFGYSDVSSQQVASAMIIELREDIAEGSLAKLDEAGFWKAFPPEGIEVVTWYVMMGIGQVVTLKVPAKRLRDVNLAIEKSAWGGFETEFYPTYDFRPVLAEIKARHS